MTSAIENVGAADYQMPIPHQEQIPVEDYTNEPAVYDPALEEKKEAAGSMKGMVAAGLIALGGLGVAAWKTKSASNYKKQVNILKQEKAALEAQLKDRTGFKNVAKRPLVALKEKCIAAWNWIKSKMPGSAKKAENK